MGKYFGTDGFRGEANENLTADHAYKIGRFLGWYYGELKRQAANYAQTECQFRYCGTAIPFLTVRSTAR